jgi:hypothetical protein
LENNFCAGGIQGMQVEYKVCRQAAVIVSYKLIMKYAEK